MPDDPRTLLRNPPAGPAPPTPLTADAKALAGMLGLSLRTIRTMDAAGKLPRPVRLLSRTVWVLSEIEDWLVAGAPDRAGWETLRRNRRR